MNQNDAYMESFTLPPTSLVKQTFFAITGNRAYRPWTWIPGPVTLFEGYQVTPTWSCISKNAKNRMHFDESEWCIIGIIYVATNFLSKTDFFRDHGESSLSTLDMNPGSRDPLRGLSGDPHLELHFEECEESNAFRWIRMMHHRIIYVATNFLSKTDFFRDHGESSLSTLDVNPGSRDPLRGLSGDPHLEPHFEESEELNAFQWIRMMHHRIIYVATNFLSKTDFFRDHGESSLSTLDVNPGSRDPLRGLSGDPHLEPHFEKCENWMHFNESEWSIIESFTLPPISLVKQTFFAITGNPGELIDPGCESWVPWPSSRAIRWPPLGVAFRRIRKSNAFRWIRMIPSSNHLRCLPPISLVK